MHANHRLTLTAPIRSEHAGDTDFAELLVMFGQTLPEKQQNLRETFEAGAMDQLRRQAHQLKGAGGGYGFPGLTLLARELEDACSRGERDAIAGALDMLLDYLGRISI